MIARLVGVRRRDRDQIVRHIVREVRDEAATPAVLRQPGSPNACSAAAATPPPTVPEPCTWLPTTPPLAPSHPASKNTCGAMLADLQAAYQHHCTYLSSDRLRSVLRTYIEDLNAIQGRPPPEACTSCTAATPALSPRCANWSGR